MKTTIALLAALLASGSAFAADGRLAYQGNGNRAGGYAYLLNDAGKSFAAPVLRQQTDLAYRGNGNRAGGYAYLLNDGGTRFVPAPTARQQVDLAYQGKGSSAGGYANALNR